MAVASILILPATLAVTFAGLSSGAATGLRALGAARRSLRAQLITSSVYIVGGLTGAVLGGAVGSAGVVRWAAIGACGWWYCNCATASRVPSTTAATRPVIQDKG